MTGLIGTTVDVTLLRAAQEDAARTRAQLQTVTDVMASAVARASRDMRYQWVSQRYLEWLGRSAEEVVGRPIVEVLGSAAFETKRPYIQRVLAGEFVTYEQQLELPTGQQRWLHFAYMPEYDASGSVEGWVGVITDISDRKAMEEALHTRDRRKDEFLAMLAHELRNPLTPIQNIAHLLAKSQPSAAEVGRYSEILLRQVQQLAHLIDDLLDVARITHRRIELQKELIAVDTLLDRAAEAVHSLFTSKQQQLRITRHGALLYVDGDSTRLGQVLVNLLNNAAKYSPAGANVDVSVDAAVDTINIRIRDQGIGIDAQTLPHIFELFMQADRSLDRSQGGLGIGLTVVKHLVELHGGSVAADSAGLGCGSEFLIRLPRSTAPALQAIVHDDSAVGGPRRRVLVVEDNADSAESLAVLLRAAGHEVRIEGDGHAALACLAQFHADHILLDIGLPGLDGYRVAQLIRQRFSERRVRLIAVTGYGRDEDRELAQRSGFDAHFTKPVDPQHLLALLAERTGAPDRS